MLLLRVLDIESSTFYGWVKQAAQPCDLVDLGLLSNIHDIWTASGQTYRARPGAPPVASSRYPRWP